MLFSQQRPLTKHKGAIFMIDTTTVGKTIAALRQQKGLSQQALADMCSVTHQAVSKWENGLALPDIQTLLFLSRHFGVSMEDILSGNVPAQKTDTAAPADEVSAPIQVPETEAPAGSTKETIPEETGMDWEQLIAMLPFAGHGTADKILLDALHAPDCKKPDMHIILSILPFASRETVEAMTACAMDTLDADMLPALAPFVSAQFFADLVRKNNELMSGRNMELLQRIIPFLPGDLVDELIQKGAANGLRWKKKGQKGSLRYDLDIDLGSIRKLQNIGKYIGDTVGSVFSNLGASLQSDTQNAPEPPSAPSKETEHPLMRIARKAVEQSNGKWLEDHYCDLDYDDQIALCRLIADCSRWELIETLVLDSNDDARRLLLSEALNQKEMDVVTRILEQWELDNDTLTLLCGHAAERKDKELIRTLAEYADTEDSLHILLDAAIKMDDWELIGLLSENM